MSVLLCRFINRALLKLYPVVWNDFRALILPLNDLQTSLCVAWTWRCPGMPRYSSTSFDFVTTFPTSYGGVCLACCGGWKSRQAGHPWTSSPQTWRLGATSSRRSSSSIFRNACESAEEKCLVLFVSLKWFTIFFPPFTTNSLSCSCSLTNQWCINARTNTAHTGIVLWVFLVCPYAITCQTVVLQ